jgi:hypothetical protein
MRDRIDSKTKKCANYRRDLGYLHTPWDERVKWGKSAYLATLSGYTGLHHTVKQQNKRGHLKTMRSRDNKYFDPRTGHDPCMIDV